MLTAMFWIANQFLLSHINYPVEKFERNLADGDR
jgi:hypothetical protein